MSRGGAREGSGRKPAKAQKVTISFRVAEETRDTIKALREAGCDVNAALERLIEELKEEI